MSSGNLQPLPPTPHPLPGPAATSQELRNSMQLLLGNEKFHIYFQHWELYQRGHIIRQVFDHGVTNQYDLLSTLELQNLHTRIVDLPCMMPQPYRKEDYTRLMLAINVVFMNGDIGLDALMGVHEQVIQSMRAERTRRGL